MTFNGFLLLGLTRVTFDYTMEAYEMTSNSRRLIRREKDNQQSRFIHIQSLIFDDFDEVWS